MTVNTTSRYLIATLALFGGMTLSSCSSAPKAGIANSANPRDEIAAMGEKLNEARLANVDVLARDEYKKSQSSLNDAKENIKDGKSQDKVLNDIRFSKTYLADAYKTAGNNQSKAPGLFEARQAALKAGADKYVIDDLKDVDEEVSDVSEKLGSVSTTRLSKLQQKYVDLERRAVIQTQLSDAQAKVNGAKEDGALKRSPSTYKKADLAVKNAESVISTNVRNPEGFAPAVKTANEAALLLMEVTQTLKSNGKGMSETSALKMVAQNRQIKGLKSDLSESKSEVVQAESELSAKDSELTKASAAVAVQKAIEESRAKFSPSEAEAFQQGPNLVIRLKNVNFASGRADLPAQALPILAKVSEVAKSLNASDIKVEGHTDSVGSSDKNKTLSQNRADSVATYLKTNGFDSIKVEAEGMGFEKPLASNKTKDGRAQNRRVDIIITPEEPAPSTATVQ